MFRRQLPQSVFDLKVDLFGNSELRSYSNILCLIKLIIIFFSKINEDIFLLSVIMIFEPFLYILGLNFLGAELHNLRIV